jgi:hypothetical protein
MGWDLRHQVLRPLLAYCTAPDDWWRWLWSNWWNEDLQGKPKYSEKTCPSAILSTTNPTWPDPGANPGRRGGKPATNPLSYGAAKLLLMLLLPIKFSTSWQVLYWKSFLVCPACLTLFVREQQKLTLENIDIITLTTSHFFIRYAYFS